MEVVRVLDGNPMAALAEQVNADVGKERPEVEGGVHRNDGVLQPVNDQSRLGDPP